MAHGISPTKRQAVRPCGRCGSCCTNYPCALSPGDLARISKFLCVTSPELFGRFLVLDYVLISDKKHYYVCPARKSDQPGKTVSLAWAFSDSPCIFLHRNRCGIEQVKPRGGRSMMCPLMRAEGDGNGYGKQRAARDWGRSSALRGLLALAKHQTPLR